MEPKGGSFVQQDLASQLDVTKGGPFARTTGQWDIRGDPLLTRYYCSLGSVVYGSHSYSMPAQLSYSAIKTERD